MAVTSTDIYDISGMVFDIQKKFMDNPDDDVLMMGIFGANNEISSNIIQNAIIMAEEYGNEGIPIRAKFLKSLLTYATVYNIDDLNATPAYMDVLIGFDETQLINNLSSKGKFTLDRNVPIMVSNIEFHLDYDIIITKNQITNNKYVYSALYDMSAVNPISDITNPYLQPPVYYNISGTKFLFITAKIRQVGKDIINKKIVSTNILENKTINFSYSNQFAYFQVVVTDPDEGDIILTPIVEGMPINGTEKYCYYSFLNASTIRIKFDRASYEPQTNSNVNIILYTTLGTGGNFKYSDDIIQTLSSERFTYNNISMLIKPMTDSQYGVNAKSKNTIKEILPKAILSRGSVNNNKDLENLFNNISDNNKIKFYKKRDNQKERMYYSYILLKDDNSNVIPTNTVDVDYSISDADNSDNDRYTVLPGKKICYKNGGYSIDSAATEATSDFLYTSPFITVINKKPVSTSYYLNIINEKSLFRFTYINQDSPLQFISSSLTCKKKFIEDPDTYKFTMSIASNIQDGDYNLVTRDDNGNIIDCSIYPVIAISNGLTKYYQFGKVVGVSESAYNIEFDLKTDGIINGDNKIKITSMTQGFTSNPAYSYFPENTTADIYLYVKLPTDYGRSYDNSLIVDNKLDGCTLTNVYTASEGINLFYNYSDIIHTISKPYMDTNNTLNYKLTGVPLVKYSYLQDDDRCMNFLDYVQYRRVYIEQSLEVIENSFTVDLKFFNTYGKSKVFEIGHNGDGLDKINLTLTFKVKLYQSNDSNTINLIKKSIKDYIENLNNISSIHMSNLVTELTTTYSDYVEYIEFVSINKYDTSYQYLEKTDVDEINTVPEFVNINTLDDMTPDINIILV